PERGKDPNLDGGGDLRPGSHRPQASDPRSVAACDGTDPQRYALREKPRCFNCSPMCTYSTPRARTDNQLIWEIKGSRRAITGIEEPLRRAPGRHDSPVGPVPLS